MVKVRVCLSVRGNLGNRSAECQRRGFVWKEVWKWKGLRTKLLDFRDTHDFSTKQRGEIGNNLKRGHRR